ncbi:serine/threonine-protein kinase VRK3 isoform 2-T3 [Discoglossus pictus]
MINFCPECGQKAEDVYKFCPSCGLKLPRDETTEAPTPPQSMSPTTNKGQRGAIKRKYTQASLDKVEKYRVEQPITFNQEEPQTVQLSPPRPTATRNPSKRAKSDPKPGLIGSYVTPEKREVKSLESSPASANHLKIIGTPSPRGKRSKMSVTEPLPENEILIDNNGKKWLLSKLLTQGNSGILYEVYSPPKSEEKCILKLDAKDGKIYNEQNFLQRAAKKSTVDKWKKAQLCPTLGIPNCIGFGLHNNYRFLVFSALGQNLQSLMEKNNYSLSERAVYQIAYRMIDTLEYIHEHEYVHGDITAENVFVNFNDLKQVYLAGYYFAFRYCPAGKHVSYRNGSRTPHEGTVTFISLDAHKGAGPSRRSDMESLGYCMLKWLSGSLPWDDVNSLSSIMDQKERYKTDIPGLLRGSFRSKKVPEVLKTYLEQVMSLNYEEKPDYEELRKHLSAAIHKLHTDPYDAVDL